MPIGNISGFFSAATPMIWCFRYKLTGKFIEKLENL